MTALAEAPPVPEVVCLGCGAHRADQTGGWLVETWPTVGGGMVRVVSCPGCRLLSAPLGGGLLCDGRCGGGHYGWAAWRGDCLDCQEPPEDADGDMWEADAGRWYCAERRCVRAWADQLHPCCHVEITRPWEVAP